VLRKRGHFRVGTAWLWAESLALCLLIAMASTLVEATESASHDQVRAYYLFSLAQQAQFRSNLPEAVHYLEEALHAADSSDLRLELASVYSTMNKSEEAEKEAREAIRLDPRSPNARSTLAQILFQRAAGGADPASKFRESETIYQDLLDKGEADEGAALALADLQAARTDPAAAAATLEKYREARPGSLEVDLHLARIYLDMGRSAEAQRLLEGVLERDDDNREARQTLSDILEQAGEPEKAVEVFRPVLDSNPDNAFVQYRLGTLLNAAGKFEEAQGHLQAALRIDPANVRVLLALGQAALGTGDGRQAEDFYQRALDADATSLEARFFLGRIAQARAEDDRALTFYDQILTQTAEKGSAQDRAFYGLASYQKALIFYLQRRYAEAATSTQNALAAATHPSEELFGLLIRIHLDAGMTGEADQDLKQGLAAIPASQELQSLQGEILLRKGDRAGARKIFQEMVKSSGDQAAAYLLILQACSRAEENREAEMWTKKGLEAHPDSEELAFQQASLLERLGRFRDAQTAFETFLQRYPENAEALNYLGYMLADKGLRLPEALGLIQHAVSIEHDNPAFLDSLGWVYFRMDQVQQAEGYLDRAAKGSREDPTVLEHLGDVKARLGKHAEALKAYRTALERGPDDPDALKKKIRKLGGDLPEHP
jgi:tetratricopeptide (TPR) repeat protein